jgi:hypothetical protein
MDGVAQKQESPRGLTGAASSVPGRKRLVKRSVPVLLALLGVVSLGGCEKPVKIAPGPAPPGTATVSLTMTDGVSPGLPAGVALVAFEIQITQAQLQPGNVALVSAPVTVEVSQLQTLTTLLGSAPVPAGSYTRLSLTVANPAITVVNDSGASISGCASGAVCQIAPASSPTTVIFTGAPFPLSIATASPIGLGIEIVPGAIIQSDLSLHLAATGGFLVNQLQPAQGELAELDEVEGIVSGVGASQFTFQTPGGLRLAVATNASTIFVGFDQIGCASSFPCLATGQPVEADLILAPDGGLTALAVVLQDASGTEQVKGEIVGINPGSSQLTLVAHSVLGTAVAGLTAGMPVTVSLEPQATFQTDFTPDNLSSYAGFFTGSGNLLAGQEVKVRAPGGSTASLVTTDRVTLASAQVSGQVLSVSDPFFALGNLPVVFTAAGASTLQVATQFATVFKNVANTASLNPGETVSTSGLIFPTPGAPTLVAEIVRKR